MDEFEAAQEDAYLEMFEEHREIALREFRQEQLQAHYRAHPERAADAVGFLAQSRALLETSPSAAHVLAFAATEVGIKKLLLEPLLSGLVHTEAVAPLLASVVFKHRALEIFKPLLFDLLRRFGDVDLATYAREGSVTPLWHEVTEHADVRNRIVHRCEAATSSQATAAVAMATEVLTQLFPAVITTLGFHLHDGYRVCGEYHLPPDLRAVLDGVRGGQPLAPADGDARTI